MRNFEMERLNCRDCD